MYYTNKETFVLSADGCMDTERGGLESILAGNDEGAKGCCFSVAMSADGIAVLSSDGCAAAPERHRGCPLVITATRSCIRRRRS